MGNLIQLIRTFFLSLFLFHFFAFGQSDNLCGSNTSESPGTPLCFMLPVEIGQGFVTGAGVPTPYTSSLRIHPSLGIGDWGNLQIGGSAALVYTNPEVELFGGARISYRMHEITAVAENPLANFFIFAEYLKGTRGNSFAAGGIGIDLYSLFQISARGSYETESKFTYGELTAGTNLMYLINPDCSCKPLIPAWASGFDPSQGYYGIVATNAKQLLLSASFNDNEIIGKLSSVSRDTLLSLNNIEDLKIYLESKDMGSVASQISEVIRRSDNQADVQGYNIPVDTAEHQKKLILAFITGWCEAIQQI
jgi:hypothetical protein